MNENKQSSSGYVEDLIRSMVQLSALELHAKTNVEKLESNLQTVNASDLGAVMDNLNVEEEHLLNVTNLRRTVMRLVQTHATENGNSDKWCEVKHSSMAMISAFEVWQANPSSEYFNYYIQTNELFIKTMIDFLGYKIDLCASCFSDRLKGD